MIFFTNVENEKFLHRFFTFPHRFKDFFITNPHGTLSPLNRNLCNSLD